MRSSKSRSRSKTNRPRTLGNIINRVFDSSGPEGKVRGTPQQIIEKYLFLARDAQLSNDRVAAENFLQHAEHYTRMLGEANRELAAEQESRQQYQPQGGQQNGQQNPGQNGGQGGQRDRDGQRQENRPDTRAEPRQDGRQDNRPDNRPEQRTEIRSENRPDTRNEPRQDRDRNEQRRDDRPSDRVEFRSDYRAEYSPNRDAEARPEPDDVIDLSGERDQGLVDLPEAPIHRPSRAASPRRPRQEEVAAAQAAPQPAPQPAPVAAQDAAAPEAAPKTRASGTRRPRSPKKPVDAEAAPVESAGGEPREAAE